MSIIPTLESLCCWVKDAWDSIDKAIIIKSLKKCGISNNLDGTEDDALFDNESTSENVPDDVPDEFFDSLFNISNDNEDFIGF